VALYWGTIWLRVESVQVRLNEQAAPRLSSSVGPSALAREKETKAT
jgi:hypothetical protein